MGAPECTLRLASARGGWAAACAVLLHFLALLMVLELSGVAHLTFDVAELASGAEHHQGHDDWHDDCEHGAGHECPPGCLNCHCAHAAMVSVGPRVETRCAAIVVERAPVAFSARPHTFTPYTERESIYRPPRLRA